MSRIVTFKIKFHWGFWLQFESEWCQIRLKILYNSIQDMYCKYFTVWILREYDFALFRLKYISHGTVGWDCKAANNMTDK